MIFSTISNRLADSLPILVLNAFYWVVLYEKKPSRPLGRLSSSLLTKRELKKLPGELWHRLEFVFVNQLTFWNLAFT